MSLLPRARRVAFRLFAALAASLSCALAFRLGVVPLVEQALPGREGVMALMRVATLGCVLLGYAAYVRRIERRPPSELRPAPRAMLLAAVAGALRVSFTTGALFALGNYTVTESRDWDGMLPIAVTIWATAMFEEVLFRGVLFRILEDAMGTWPALWAQSLVFGALHLLNIEGDAITFVLTLAGTVVVGAMWTWVFVATRNLWVTGANHAAWNLAIVMTGVPLSGKEEWRALVPLQSSYQGPVWLTGGVYGPEGSVLCIAATTLALVALVRWHRRQRAARPGALA